MKHLQYIYIITSCFMKVLVPPLPCYWGMVDVLLDVCPLHQDMVETWAALYHLGLRGISADQVVVPGLVVVKKGLIFRFN